MGRTGTRPYIDRILGGEGALDAILHRLRDAGMSYEDIAKQLDTEYDIDVTSTTVRRWLGYEAPDVDRQPDYETDPDMGLVE